MTKAELREIAESLQGWGELDSDNNSVAKIGELARDWLVQNPADDETPADCSRIGAVLAWLREKWPLTLHLNDKGASVKLCESRCSAWRPRIVFAATLCECVALVGEK